MLLTQMNCLQTRVSMSKGPDIFSMIHFCQIRGVYHASGPLAFSGSLWPNHLIRHSMKLVSYQNVIWEFCAICNATFIDCPHQEIKVLILVPWSLFLDYLMISLSKATCSLIIWWMGEACFRFTNQCLIEEWE